MQTTRDKPPYSNTGAQNTCTKTLRACLDWFGATFPDGTPPEKIFDYLGLPSMLFVQMDRGLMGYRHQMRFGNIMVLYDGSQGMGVHVEMTGQGCRQFEQLSQTGWGYLLMAARTHGNITRLDLAIDDFVGYFTVGQVIDAARKGLISSRFKSAVQIESIKLDDGSTKGQTLYMGSPQSRIKVRFYDKLQERLAAGKDIEDGITHWVRTELELRDERATMLADHILDDWDLDYLIRSVINNYVTVRKRGTDTNKSRWPVAKWWADFIDDACKLKLTKIAPDRTIERIDNWVFRQVKKSLAMLYRAYGNDMGYIGRLIYAGLDDLNDYDKMVINAYRSMIDNYEWTKKETAISSQAD